ncbi:MULTISPECIES: molybdenum cofactor synthesis domain-containing protein [unclassified Arsukibacterium]|uniref:molybdenum cofactor synthesis domain-containing protein n=1 Tax=unclassified Arsukibacterium TaxID=2635278 RepID=UPI000C8E7B81|nr:MULTISPECIES: molybdenum cofactor synthesis domain-containing protein [unclassified Arsukibacterium]MAA94342.1 molybdenum cofactor biosynthesis protein [Rheinheimera sp.]MDX1538869.1 molybdenum cofactor synthesis domain-containing protein [Arsukibacterium sp.]HAW91978.1 molybdenum cofactor biosynthesis protein [Candidatus Azambacteria bacterium]|tara:strand:- start:12191 stop:12730 length:540 start_codon:yes stop_codon:yes gene_type:complete
MPRPDLSRFYPLTIAVLTVSDSRSSANDSSGDLLCQLLQTAGHQLAERIVLPNNKYHIRAVLSQWIASETIQVVLLNGGTGYAKGNCTVEALTPLMDTQVPGFGELFRQLTFNELGSAAMQSGALAGLANGTLLFAMPGSGGACRLAMQQLILPQLDSKTGPCNFVAHVKNNPINNCGA